MSSKDLELHMVLTATDQGLSGTIRSAKEDIDKLDTAFDDTADSANKADKENKQLSESINETGEQAGKTKEQFSGLNEEVDKNAASSSDAAEETENFVSTLSTGMVRAGAWGSALATLTVRAGAWGLALAGATALAAGLGGALRTDAIREMDILADSVGTSTQALSEWQYAGETLYLTGDKVSQMMQDASDKIGDYFTSGVGEAADIFENLNVQANELVHLSPDQQLLKIGAALEDVDNRSQKIFFLESLASDASRLLPLLENNGAELKRLQLQAQVLGISISDIDAAKVSQAGAAMGQVRGIFTGMANDLTIELAPVLGGISESLVDSAVEAGGFRDAMRTAIDVSVTGIGFLLDVGQQFHIILKYSEQGWLALGVAGTNAMAAVAESTASVINDALSPMQTALSWVIDKYAQWIEFISRIGGPIADKLKGASDWLKGFSQDVKDFSVDAQDIINLNQRMSDALVNSANELDALLNADAPSDQLRQWVENLRTESDAAAAAQQKLGKQVGKTGGIVTSQTDTYADLVKELEAEYKLIGLTERARQIEINQRKLAADATDEQKDAIALLTGRLYDHQQAQKESEAGAEAWATVTENALKSVDDSFRKLFRSGLDGWDDFWGQMKSTAKDMLAELAYTLAKEKLMVSVGMNVTGQGGGSGSASSLSGGGQNPLTSMFSGSGMGYATSNLINQGATAISGNALYSVNNPALVNNVAAIKSGAVSVSSPATQVGGAAMAGLSAYGFAQQYGAAGGFAAGTASTALMGGAASMIGGSGFMAGASSALAGLGPVGWAALGIGALLGGLSGKPSDESQWAGFTGADNAAYEGGESGDKFSQENRDAATGVADILNAFNQSLDTFTGQKFVDSIEVTAESVNGFTIKSDSSVANANDLKYSPNGSAYIKGDQEIYAGKDLTDGLNKTIEHMAERAGVALDIYRELAQEDELLAVAYERLNRQQITVTASAKLLDLQFGLVDEAGMRAADALVTAAGGLQAFQAQTAYYYEQFFSEEERKAVVVGDAQAAVSAWNNELGRSGAVIIDSRAEFRQYIEALDLTTAAGQAAWASAMQLAGAIVTLDDALGGSQLGTLTADQQTWFTDRAQQIADNYQREMAQLNDLHRTRVNTLNTELNAARQLHAAVNSLKLSDISPLTSDQRVGVAQAEFARLQVLVESGNMDAVSKLGNAAQSYLKELSAQRGADDVYVNEFNDVTRYLEQLGLEIGSDLDPLTAIQQLEQQLLNEQRMLTANSRQQLSVLADQYAELTGIDSGIQALNDLLAGLPSQLADALNAIKSTGSSGSAAAPDSQPPGSTTGADYIESLYNDGLNRSSDAEGKAFWQAALNDGMSKAQLKTVFGEAAVRNGEADITPGYFTAATQSASQQPAVLSDQQFIDQLYTRGLGRVADAAGAAYWLNELSASVSRDDLKEAFFEGATANGEHVTYFANGGVVTQPQNFRFGHEISGQLGQRGEAGAEAIIPVGSGYIPAKFDTSLINELRELRKQNADQAQQIAQLNSTMNRLVSVTDSHGKTAKTQRDRQSRDIRRSNRQPVQVTT